MRAFMVTVLALSCAGYAATAALESAGSEPVPGPSTSPTAPVPCGSPDTGLEDPLETEQAIERWKNDSDPHNAVSVLCVVHESDD